MYAKNIATFLLNLVKDKQIQINLEDEIIRDTLIARDGQVVNPRIQQLLGTAASKPVPDVRRPLEPSRTTSHAHSTVTLQRKDRDRTMSPDLLIAAGRRRPPAEPRRRPTF